MGLKWEQKTKWHWQAQGWDIAFYGGPYICPYILTRKSDGKWRYYKTLDDAMNAVRGAKK